MRATRLLVVAAILLATAGGRAECATVYTQPSDYPSPGFYYSNDLVQFRVYDNFTLASTETIASVSWQGAFIRGTDGPLTGFTIAFWDDSSGEPGALIVEESIAGNANQSAAFADNDGNPTFNYSAVLPTAFTAVAGQTYWISIFADSDPYSWGWHTATSVDDIAYLDVLPPTPSRGRLTVDLAFSLASADRLPSVPEPTSLALAGFAGLGMAVRAWRRRRQQAAKSSARPEA